MTGSRRRIAAIGIALATAAVAGGCGGSGPSTTAAPTPTAPPALPVTVPVPPSAGPELARYRTAVALAERALQRFGTALEGRDGGLPEAEDLRSAVDGLDRALARVGALRLVNAAVKARRDRFLEAGAALVGVLSAYTDDVAADRLGEANARSSEINAALLDFAVAARA
jgi:hypothetical protein